MATTYEKIASVTVGSGGAANIEFTSIPGTFDDIVCHYSLRSNRASTVDNINLEFNGSSANLSSRRLTSEGSNAASSSFASDIYIETQANNQTATTFGSGYFYVPNYAGSTNKSVSADSVSENNAAFAIANLVAGLWSNTAAITSFKLTPLDGTLWQQHSSATLYGIKKS